MNIARREQWKQAFTFQGAEISTLGDLLVATCLGVFSFLWPGHQVLVFAIIFLSYSAIVQFVFTPREDRRLLKALLWNVLAIAIFAAYIGYTAR